MTSPVCNLLWLVAESKVTHIASLGARPKGSGWGVVHGVGTSQRERHGRGGFPGQAFRSGIHGIRDGTRRGCQSRPNFRWPLAWPSGRGWGDACRWRPAPVQSEDSVNRPGWFGLDARRVEECPRASAVHCGHWALIEGSELPASTRGSHRGSRRWSLQDDHQFADLQREVGGRTRTKKAEPSGRDEDTQM